MKTIYTIFAAMALVLTVNGQGITISGVTMTGVGGAGGGGITAQQATNAALGVLSQSSVAYLSQLAGASNALRQLTLDATNTLRGYVDTQVAGVSGGTNGGITAEAATNAALGVLSQSSVAYLSQLAGASNALRQLTLDATNTLRGYVDTQVAGVSGGTNGGITAQQVTNAVHAVMGQSATNWYNVLDFGADPYFTLDSTAAFQDAIDAAAFTYGSTSAVLSVIRVPWGHYKVLGTLTVPQHSTYSFTNFGAIELLGEFPAVMLAGTIPNGPLPIVGSVVEFWAANTNCFQVEIRTNGGTYNFSMHELRFKNIDFRQSDYVQSRTMFNLTNATGARFEGCAFQGTNWQGAFNATLPHVNNIFVDGPAKDQGNTFILRNCNFIGAGQLLKIAEHVTIDFINIGAAFRGVVVKDNNLAAVANRITAQGCNYPIYYEGTGGLNVQLLVNEKIASGWMTNIADIGGGSSSLGYGEIGIHVKDDVLSNNNGIRNLQQNVHVVNLRDGAEWYSDKAGSSIITRGPKIVYQPASQAAFTGGLTLLKHNETTAYPFLPSPVVSGQGMMALRGGGWTGAAGDIAPSVIEFGADGTVTNGWLPTSVSIATGSTEANAVKRLTVSSGGTVTVSNNLVVGGVISGTLSNVTLSGTTTFSGTNTGSPTFVLLSNNVAVAGYSNNTWFGTGIGGAANAGNSTNFWGMLSSTNLTAAVITNALGYIPGTNGTAANGGGPDISTFMSTYAAFDEMFTGYSTTQPLGPLALKVFESSGTYANNDQAYGYIGRPIFGSGTTTGNYDGLGSSIDFWPATGFTFTNEWRFKLTTANSAADGYIFRCGLMSAFTGGLTEPARGCYLRVDTNNATAYYVVRDTTETNYTSGVTLSAGTFYKFRVVVNGTTSVTFTINDTNEVTMTNYIPSSIIGWGIGIVKNGGSSSRTFNADYGYIGYTMPTR